MGRSIYLTDKEIEAILDVVGQWNDIMSSGEETADLVEEDYQNGLGSAMYKLSKGRHIRGAYEEYKPPRSK